MVRRLPYSEIPTLNSQIWQLELKIHCEICSAIRCLSLSELNIEGISTVVHIAINDVGDELRAHWQLLSLD